jgi:predicted metalloprotease with PDZ domain
MSYPKLLSLTYKLSDATKVSIATWKETETEGLFQVSFADNSIRIGTRDSKQDQGADEYFVSIFNSQGDLVEEIGDEDGEDETQRRKLYRLLKEMYETARRQAKGVDQVLDEILRELDDRMPF